VAVFVGAPLGDRWSRGVARASLFPLRSAWRRMVEHARWKTPPSNFTVNEHFLRQNRGRSRSRMQARNLLRLFSYPLANFLRAFPIVAGPAATLGVKNRFRAAAAATPRGQAQYRATTFKKNSRSAEGDC